MSLNEFICSKRKYWTGAVVANQVIQTKNNKMMDQQLFQEPMIQKAKTKNRKTLVMLILVGTLLENW